MERSSPEFDAVQSAEATFILRQNMNEAMIVPLNRGDAAIYSSAAPAQGEEPRPCEDAALLIPVDEYRSVLAVADGMGGQPCGAMAASLAVQAINEAVQTAKAQHESSGNNGSGSSLRDAILTGFEDANRAVTDIGVGAATTLAVVEIQRDSIRPYHVGDSFIMLIGNRGRIKLQTMSHSPVGYAVESGLLAEREAMHHEDRHLVSNMVGSPEMRIDIGPTIMLGETSRDTLLIASDGLSDNLHTHEIVELTRKGPLQRAAESLATLARQRMISQVDGEPSKPDDLTFILWRRWGK
ncbi:MAG TPA: serine/threonine-protein phosphatase [Phycisphaerales bacterium]|nr:serine/threonine-protein phosphatase [Phycisphaerales bacterium]